MIILQILVKFVLGALIYLGIEVMWDGHTDRRMGLVGGLAFVITGRFADWFNLPSLTTWILIGSVIVIMELFAGLMWNRDFKIWDYRNIPLNYKGQISLPFFLLWVFPIAPFILWMDKLLSF